MTTRSRKGNISLFGLKHRSISNIKSQTSSYFGIDINNSRLYIATLGSGEYISDEISVGDFLMILSNQATELRIVPRCIPIITVVNNAIVARMPITGYGFFTIYARSHVLIIIKVEDTRAKESLVLSSSSLMYLYCTELNQGPLPSATPRIKLRVRFACLKAIMTSVLVDSCSSIFRKRKT